MARRRRGRTRPSHRRRELGGFVVETLLRAAPERTRASFYRTAIGAGIDLVLELPGNRIWAVEIKRGHVPAVSRGFRTALADVALERAFLVHGGEDRYPKAEAIGLRALAEDDYLDNMGMTVAFNTQAKPDPARRIFGSGYSLTGLNVGEALCSEARTRWIVSWEL